MKQIPLMGFDVKQPQQQPQQQDNGIRKRDESRRKNASRHRRRRKKNYTLHYILLFLLTATTLTILSFTVFFNIKDINVTGETPLDSGEIIKQAGITVGDNLLLINKDKIEKNIMEKTYLLDGVIVKQKFPSKLEIELIMTEPTLCVKSSDKYYYFSKALRLVAIETTRTKPDIITYVGVKLSEMKLGDYLVQTDNNGLEMCLVLQEAITKSPMTDISYVDMIEDVNIDIYYKEQIQIKVGSVTDIDYKLESANRVITQKITDGQVGLLDVQTERKAYFRQIEITMP